MVVASVLATARDFGAFYRVYARSGVHAASTALLTALGLLTVVSRWFAVLALAAYVLPPLYLYLDDGGAVDGRRSGEERPAAARPGTDAESDDDASGGEWSEGTAPTEATLRDVAASRAGPFAVGDGGVALLRRGDDWERVAEEGPSAQSNTLRGVDASADGRAVWFVGDGGDVGRYDVVDGTLTDHSAPEDRTSTWEDVAVVGPAGEERVHLVDGSGAVVRGRNGAGGVRWGAPTKPGSGSSIAAIAFADEECGFLCDTSGAVYGTSDGGGRYERLGIDGADADPRDVAVLAPDRAFVADGNGAVFRYDGSGGTWTPTPVAEGALSAVDCSESRRVAAGLGGAVYEFAAGDWERATPPGIGALHGVALGPSGEAIAVGESGRVVERRA